jgi:hypothetical protein
VHVHVSVFSWKYCKQRYWFLHLIVPQTGYLKIICRVRSVEVRALAPQKPGLIRRLPFNFVEAVLSGSLRFA